MIKYTETYEFLEDIRKLINSRSYIANHFIAAEECGELIQATSKMVRLIESRHGKRENFDGFFALADHILEESADVMICIYMLITIYGFNVNELDEMVERKMQRNLERIG